jgi:TonB-linked SusC/RagA family outer membrane protein
MRVSRSPCPNSSPRRWYALIIALAACASATDAQAQMATLNGRVTGENGQPITGAQVRLVNTTLGTLTGESGRYILGNLPPAQYRVRAQMLGYRPVERAVTLAAGQTLTEDFPLRKQVLELDALVVTGIAGAARQREVGNAVSQIDMSKIQEPPQSVGQMLQGRAPGMTVMPSSAGAGSGSMIRLRGNVSVAMSNQPLIYVDGVRLRSDGYAKNIPPTGSDLRGGNDIASPLNDINPNDIERIEILKGAAASTLYGTEAAAGVIQIFTKSGHAGKPQWSMQVDQGFARSLPFGPDPSTAPPSDTIPQIYRDSFPDRFAGLPDRGVSRAGGSSRYLFIDPWLRNASQRRLSLSIGGGGDALRYFVSGTATNEDGVLPNDNEQRKVIRGNFTFTPISNLLFSFNTSYTKDAISNTAAGNNAQGLTLNAFRRDRNYASNDRPEIVAKLLNQELTSDIDHLITGGTLTWSPTTNLTNRFTLGYDLAQIANRNLRPFGFVSAPTGIISNRENSYQNLTFDYAGSLAVGIRPSLRSTISWGGQAVTTQSRETSAYGENFPGPGLPTVSSAGTTLGFEERQRVVNAGFFGQTIFDVKNRYFLTLGGRVDGNSAFGSKFGLQTYPKASVSWVASEESFWPKWNPEMKLRAAIGQSGRAPGAFDAIRTWENPPSGWGGQPAFFPRSVGNSELGPERTTEIEMGFDGALLSDRVSTSFTWYQRKVNQALFSTRQIPSLGFLNAQLQNVGRMGSNGVEASLTAVLVRRKDFEWSVGGSYYTNNTKVESLGGAADFSIGNFGWIMKGQAIPIIRTDFCLAHPDQAGAPEVISPTAANPTACNYGPNTPPRTIGVNSSLSLPYGVKLNARGEHMGGHYMYDGAAFNAVTRSVRWPGCYDFYTLQESGRLSDATQLQRARCTASTTKADYFIYPADFFKLRDLSMAIPLPARLMRGATSSMLTLAGHNIYKSVNKDFPVFDPETGNNGGFDSQVRSILEQVPPPATYTASIRLAF